MTSLTPFRGRRAIAGIAGLLLAAGVTAVTTPASAARKNAVHTGAFTVIAKDFSFSGVPARIKAFNGLTNVTVVNESPDEAHELLFVRLKDTKDNKGFTRKKAEAELVEHYNFEAQEDPHNVGGFTPGFARLVPENPLSLRDASMGGRADVFRDSFGGEDTHEVEAVPPLTTATNGIDLSRPGRYLYFCPITAKALNDPSQEPHYLQDPGQIGFLQVVR